jgi:hypothetical protein
MSIDLNKTVVVVVQGGVVQDVFGNFDRLVIIDYDNLDAGDKLDPKDVVIARHWGVEIDD